MYLAAARNNASVASGASGSEQALPDPPLQYKILLWARDAGVSYFDLAKLPMWLLLSYLDLRELEMEYGQDPIVPKGNL